MSLQLDDLGRHRDRIPLKLESLPPLRACLPPRAPAASPPRDAAAAPVSTPSVLERTPRGRRGAGRRYDVAQHAIRGPGAAPPGRRRRPSAPSPRGEACEVEAGRGGAGRTGRTWSVAAENLVAAAQSKRGGGGRGARRLASLRGERMHADAIERLYRALYVYSVGFADVLQQLSEHVPERSKLIPKARAPRAPRRGRAGGDEGRRRGGRQVWRLVREQEEGLSSERRRHEAEVAALDARAEQLAGEVQEARSEQSRLAGELQQQAEA
eukprot:tig00000572_g2211.t1